MQRSSGPVARSLAVVAAVAIGISCGHRGDDVKPNEAARVEVAYHPNGKKAAEGPRRAGQREGHWTSWDPDGNVVEEGDYRAGIKEGDWEEATLDAETHEWQIARGRRVDGRRDGTWRVESRDGRLRRVEEWHDDAINGTWKRYHANGQLAEEGRKLANQGDGAWTYWYENGQKKAEGVLDHGMAEGLWKGWDPDGRPQYEGAWRHGVQIGTWKRWGADGTIETTEHGPDGAGPASAAP